MQSADDHLISPYSTPSFTGSFTSPGPDSQPAPAFHRYQHGDLAAPWFATSSPEQHAPISHVVPSPNPQSYQVLGPYMMTGQAMYGQSPTYDSGGVSNQQMQAQFSPGMADPRTPAASPANSGVAGVYYQNPPASGFPAQHQVSVPVGVAYNSPGAMGHPADYSAAREGNRGHAAPLYRDDSTASLESMSSNNYPQPTAPSTQQRYTFVASETSSFTSDGSQSRSQKAPKKRGSVTATRRPRKPPPDVVTQPKLQKAPEIASNAARTGSPKRARTEVSQPESKTTLDRTPDSSRTLSPGTISKAHIGQRPRASTDASQRSNAASTADEHKSQRPDSARQSRANDTIHVHLEQQKPAEEEDKQELRLLKARQEDLQKQVTDLGMIIRRYERDRKCKALETASISAGTLLRDEATRTEAGTGKQISAQKDLRRPSNASIMTTSTASTAISSRNSPTETVYSTSQDWGYSSGNGFT